MQSEFKTIDTYLSECNELLSNDSLSDGDSLSEQKVPQSMTTHDIDGVRDYSEPDLAAFYTRINALESSSKCKLMEESKPLDMSINNVSFLDTDNRETRRILDLDSRVHNDVIKSQSDIVIKREPDVDMSSYSCQDSCAFWNDYDPFCAEIVEPKETFYYQDLYDCGNSDIESVQTLLINQVKRDINTISSQLGICQDPHYWSEDDVHLWVYFMLQQHRLSVREANNFVAITGRKMCSLSEDDLRFAAPVGGGQIFVQLEIWKNASKIEDSDISFGLPKLEPSIQPNQTSPPCHMTPSHPIASFSYPPTVTSHVRGPSLHTNYATNLDAKFDPSEPPERKTTIHLWQFLKQLLISDKYPRAIRWIDRSQGIFKIENSQTVAKLWGRRKNRPAMNYDKLSRSIRQYYKKGIITKTVTTKRLVYQFCRPYLS